MNYATVMQRGDDDLTVTAVVTAGVQGNAACAGDPTTWRETPAGCRETVLHGGTINAQVLLNCPLDRGRLGASRSHHDGRQNGGVATARGSQPLFHRTWPPEPPPTSFASPLPCDRKHRTASAAPAPSWANTSGRRFATLPWKLCVGTTDWSPATLGASFTRSAATA